MFRFDPLVDGFGEPEKPTIRIVAVEVGDGLRMVVPGFELRVGASTETVNTLTFELAPVVGSKAEMRKV